MRLIVPFSAMLATAAFAACATAPHPPGSYTAVTDGGGSVHYEDYASDKKTTPIVLVHGGFVDRRVWSSNLAGLSERRRVIAVDLPGHGRSGVPAHFSMDVYADAVAAAMDDASVERAVLVGQSMGVAVIHSFSRNYPGRTAGLVCIDGPLRRNFNPADFETLRAALKGEEYREVVQAFVSQVIDSSELLTDNHKVLVKEMVDAIPQGTLVGDLDALLDETIWAMNDPIEVPVLVLNAESPDWTDDYRKSVDKLVTGQPYEYVTWAGVSHLLMLEKPAELNEAVLAFVAAVER